MQKTTACEGKICKEKRPAFNGAVAIITGGASGIGAALGRELARRGTEVVLADRQLDLAEQVAAEIRNTGRKATAEELNVTDYHAVEALVYKTLNRVGRLNYMFNNAGIGIMGPAATHAIEDWDTIIDVNLRGVIHGVQAAYQVMREQGCGHIVNTASFAGLLASPGCISYAATKHAVVGLSKTLRVEAAPLGVRVSVLCPGFIRTPILDKILMKLSAAQQEKAKQLIETFKPMPPDVFAVQALDAVDRNEAVIVLPGRYKLFWWVDRLFPSWSLRLMAKRYQSNT